MLDRIKNSVSAVFAFNFLISLILYLPTLHSKFIYDINSHFITYERMGWEGFYRDWGENTIRWGIHTVNFILWYFFGASDHVWFIITIALHALVGTLLYTLVRKLLSSIDFRQAYFAAFTSMLIYLVSPYHTETIVWGATLFYITFAVAFLTIIHSYLLYLESGKIKYVLLIYVLYFFCMVTFEVFIIIGPVLLVLYLMTRGIRTYYISFIRFASLFFIPMIVFIVLYFLWNRWLIGQWVGHYGTAVHFNTDPFLLIPNFSKYMFKYIYVHLFFTYEQRDKLYNHLPHIKWIIGAVTIYGSIGLLILYILFAKNVASQWRMLGGFLALFVVTLLPVLNLYFAYSKDIELDRYMYLPSLFFCSFLILFFCITLHRLASIPMLAILVVSLFFLHRNAMYWYQVGRINSNLAQTFKWQDAKRIFLLANSDNFCGAYQMRDMPQSSLAEILHVQRHIDIAPKLHTLLQYNMFSASDSSYHQVVDSTTVRYSLSPGTGWFWYQSYGASSYETALYKVGIEGNSFVARFKDKQPGDVYIYQCQDKWVEVTGF